MIEEIKNQICRKYYGMDWPDVLWKFLNGPSMFFKDKKFNDLVNEIILEGSIQQIHAAQKRLICTRCNATKEDILTKPVTHDCMVCGATWQSK
jgi:hypothetical protein